ncbi:MAG: helix-turn-helix transcriptional regulator [Gammaproteobacteria bacterium]|uniref:LuxR C-terminal-related transcriptional regulator n=1 Tax=Pseudomaricurvus alcaniphilus TaxID=1166482 RepID=UPI001408BA54|nr:helix-turn-helix transcriptional regulator [Pseudomaricurvus alcaniphilus]MBR9910622.1 helix-turn-helix transcriptional regulator [Gammaproteobacteria bacterium]NHN36855.1 helix-turn-helix transcriptional regulator [Pseudomaricurvus alcaniphilus]
MRKLELALTDYDELVHSVYAGIDEVSPWSSFLDRLCTATGSRDASLVFSVLKPEENFYLLTNDREFWSRSTKDSIRHLLSMSETLHISQPEPSTIAETLRADQFYKSELYLNYLKPIGIRFLLSQDLAFEDTYRIKLSVERTDDCADFGEAEKAVFEWITPHLRRAVQLREERIQHSRLNDITNSTLSKVSVGALTLDADGRVITTNSMAKVILQGGRGLTLLEDRLKATDPRQNQELKSAIKHALHLSKTAETEQSGTGFRIEKYPGKPQLDMVIKPISNTTYDGTNLASRVVIYLNDCERSNVDLNIEMLRNIYSMTPCEAQISVYLAEGKTQAQVAELLGVSINTVKTHLRGIYDKLDAKNQSQVVAILNRSSARLL